MRLPARLQTQIPEIDWRAKTAFEAMAAALSCRGCFQRKCISLVQPIYSDCALPSLNRTEPAGLCWSGMVDGSSPAVVASRRSHELGINLKRKSLIKSLRG